ncbi:MAG: hypothetical protein K0R17_3314 [Rariglobus sp.]|jgi:hypothetical protein|nr:hypothetical protein [Rariglobus sp.]
MAGMKFAMGTANFGFYGGRPGGMFETILDLLTFVLAVILLVPI